MQTVQKHNILKCNKFSLKPITFKKHTKIDCMAVIFQEKFLTVQFPNTNMNMKRVSLSPCS